MCHWKKQFFNCKKCLARMAEPLAVKFICQRALDIRPLEDPMTKFGNCGLINPIMQLETVAVGPCEKCWLEELEAAQKEGRFYDLGEN